MEIKKTYDNFNELACTIVCCTQINEITLYTYNGLSTRNTHSIHITHS